uniref:Coenzyme Q-binding protein COQ10 START domain-containing protein n=1 Tax=Brassica oleracea var. oleracea TaxID=109376 RepID=A0A0D3C751_BRAOL
MSVTATHMNTINHLSASCKTPNLQLPICSVRRFALPCPRKPNYSLSQLLPKSLNGSSPLNRRSRFNTRKRLSVSMEWQDCTVKMEVDIPVSVAYNFYLDRESFPKWMPFISSVEPTPNQKIHWRSLEGLPNKGSVRFFPKGPSSCLVELTVSYEVPALLTPVASALRPFLETLLRAPTTKSAACFSRIQKSATYSSRSMLLSSLSSSSSPASAKLLNSSNGSSSSSSSPKPFRPVMRSREADRLEEERLLHVQWQDITVKMVVDAPASVAYKLYADRELFPKWLPFLSSVEAVEGSPDLSRYLVKFESFGKKFEYYFLAKNLEPIPDRKLHWRSIEGFANRGSVRFFHRGPSSCLVEINFSFEVPHAFAPVAFLMKPFMERLIRGGLESFAAFVKTT